MPISLLWIAACATAPVEPVRAPIPPLVPDGVVLKAVVTRSPGAVPPRFTIPPEAWITDDQSGLPPIGKTRHALCADLPGVRDGVIAALRSAEPEARESAFRGLFEGSCRSADWCAWVTTVLTDEPHEMALRGLWLATQNCVGPDVDRLILTEGPPWAVSERVARIRLYDARVETIAAKFSENTLDDALAALALVDDPAAERALIDLHRRAPRSLRDAVALSLWGRSSPAATELYDEVCSRVDDRRCRYLRTDPLTALADTIDAGDDPAALFVRYPNYRASLLSALSTCVGDGITPRPCLVALAHQDRDAAASLVAGLDDPAVADLQKALTSDRGEVLAALQALGFPPLVVPADSDAVTVPELLEAAGQAMRIVDPVYSQPHNEQLLYPLAALAGAPDVEFDELRPSPEAPEIDGRTPAITLYAWAGGWRYRALQVQMQGWNVPDDVGFLNQVLIERGSDRRLALDVDRTHAIVGSADQLQALADNGWVRFYQPPPEPEPEAGTTVTPIVGEPVQLEPTDAR